MEEQNDIEIKSKEVNELLTAVPKLFVRWGITIIFAIMLLSLLAAACIRYPDVIAAKVVITASNLPVVVIPQTTGKIVVLNVKNNALVKKGTLLFIAENTANYNDVAKADSLLDVLQQNLKTKQLPPLISFDALQLGEITPAFIAFLKSYTDFKLQQQTQPYQKEIALLTNKQEALKKQNSNQTAASVAIGELEREKLELQLQAYKEQRKYITGLELSIQAAQEAIHSWQQQYVFSAPVAGRVLLPVNIMVNKNFKINDSLLTIVPEQKQEVIAQLFLPIQNAGKLKSGQTVNIQLNDYMADEYGVLKGKIKSISMLPQQQQCILIVSLPDDLMTSHHKKISYKNGTEGTAEVLTENKSIFDRIFQQFKNSMRK